MLLQLLLRHGRATTWLPRRAYATAPPSAPPSAPPRIMFFASELGGLVGMNPYASLIESFETVWLRTDRSVWDHHKRIVEQRTGVPVRTLDECIAAHISPSVQAILDAHTVERVATYDRTLLARAQRAVRAETKRSVDAVWQPKVAARAVSLLNRVYGAAHEPITLHALERDRDVLVRDSNAKFYSKVMGTCEAVAAAMMIHGVDEIERERVSSLPPREWAIGGRIDGFVGHALIELKNRTQRFMTPLPLYDRAQFEAYLRLVDLPHGELIECIRVPLPSPSHDQKQQQQQQHASSPPSSSIHHKRTLLHRDDAVWNGTLVPLLQRFANFLHTFLAHPHAIESYLSAHTEHERLRILAPIVPPSFAAATATPSSTSFTSKERKKSASTSAIVFNSDSSSTMASDNNTNNSTSDDDHDGEDHQTSSRAPVRRAAVRQAPVRRVTTLR